jgi:hypothetical protein
MQLNPISKNMNEVITNNGKVLFSYKTPVAYHSFNDNEYYKTAMKWSNTTTRHINKWLDGVVATEKPQDFFDELTK